MIYLKADTIVEVTVGPAVAVGDGFTPVTGLSIASADEAELLKYNGSTAITATAITGTVAAITNADGYYTLDLSATDTDTEGPMILLINDDSLILPIRHEFMVVNANVYDSMFAASGVDVLQVDVREQVGTTVPAPATAGVPKVDITHQGGGAIPAPAITGIPDVNVTHYEDSAVVSPSTAGLPKVDVARLDGNIVDASSGRHNVNVDQMGTGVITAAAVSTAAVDKMRSIVGMDGLTASATGTTTTLIDSALTEADFHWEGLAIEFTSGTNLGQVRHVWNFIASSDTLQFTPALEVATASSDTYNLLPWAPIDVVQWDSKRIEIPTVNGVPHVDITYQGGGAIPTPAITGVPDVNVTEWIDNGVAAFQPGRPDVTVKNWDNVAVSLTGGDPKVHAAGISNNAISDTTLTAAALRAVRAVQGQQNNFTSANGTTTTLVDASLTQADGHWDGDWVEFTSGANAGQVRLITGFVATSDTMTFAPAVETATVNGDAFIILAAAQVDVSRWNGDAVAVSAVAGVPEVDVTHQGGGAIPPPATTGVPDVNVVEWLDAVVAAYLRGEPSQSAPPLSASTEEKIDYLYMTLRNKKDNDGNTTQVYLDDETTVAFKSTTSEAGGVVTEEEKVSGP